VIVVVVVWWLLLSSTKKRFGVDVVVEVATVVQFNQKRTGVGCVKLLALAEGEK